MREEVGVLGKRKQSSRLYIITAVSEKEILKLFGEVETLAIISFLMSAISLKKQKKKLNKQPPGTSSGKYVTGRKHSPHTEVLYNKRRSLKSLSLRPHCTKGCEPNARGHSKFHLSILDQFSR